MDKLEKLQKEFAQTYKTARDKPEVIQALKLGYDLGCEQAYWDWRDTVLSWETKHDLSPIFTAYLKHLRNKPKPRDG